MRQPPLILVVDDNEANVDILATRLASQGYAIETAGDGEEALTKARALLPDLMLLDVMMPRLDGLEVARRLRADASLPYIPIIHVTAKTDVADVVAGLDAGGDEYLAKPFDHAALSARVRSILRAKELHDRVGEQARQLERQAQALEEWNRTLEARVAAQVEELERLHRLKRFLPPQVADVVLSSNPDQLLASHRREITVVFCDLRGFTAFSEISEPEDVMRVLGEYHAIAGALIDQYEATLERFAGDGLMLFFNDPLPCPDPVAHAVQFALAMRAGMEQACAAWRLQGHEIGFGIGMAHGHATLGRIGFSGRGDYAAIGTVVNTASRVCDLARTGEILATGPVAAGADGIARVESIGEIALAGLRRPTPLFRLDPPA